MKDPGQSGPRLCPRGFGSLAMKSLLLLALLLVSMDAAAALTHIDRAQATVIINDQPAIESEIALPFHWDALQRGKRGRVVARLDLPADAYEQAQAVFIARVGNTFEIRIDGATIDRRGTHGGRWQDFGKKPRMVQFPPAPHSGAARVLEIEFEAQATRRGGLSLVTVGPAQEIEKLYRSEYRKRVTAYLVIAIVSLVLGSVVFLIWLRQRQTLYLIYAVSEWLWALQMTDALIEQSPLPWPWWGILVSSARGLAALGMMKFMLIVIEKNEGITRRLVLALMPLTPFCLALALSGLFPAAEVLLKFAVETLFVWVGIIVVKNGLRSDLLERRILAFSMLVVMGFILRDLLVLIVLPYWAPMLGLSDGYARHYGTTGWALYGWVLFGFALAWVIAERLRRSAFEVETMNRDLQHRLAAREQELRKLFLEQADIERKQATLDERQRLMRDMHDGLGSQLVGAVQLAQDPSISRETLAQALQDAVDNLKLTVDAMQDSEGDIGALLGTLRYRLASRLRAAGVELQWEVAPLPAVEGWQLNHSRHLQMILFEAFSNLIAHARATRACLTAHLHDQRILVTLADNGRGFDPLDARGGQGLANMRLRARALQAELTLTSDEMGTRLELSLPLTLEQ